MTYRELKRKLSEFTEEQLDQSVVAGAPDCRSIFINSVWIVEEDQINPSGDGMEPVSEYADEPDILATEPVVCKAGTIFLDGET